MAIVHPTLIPATPPSAEPLRLAVTRVDLTARRPGPLRLALLSDPHIGARRDELVRGQATAAIVQANLAGIPAEGLDASLWLGDLAMSEGRPADYALFAELLEPLAKRLPTVLGIGNHDLRSEFLKAFTGAAPEKADGKLHLLTDVRTPHARLILLDTCLSPSVVGGAVGKAQLDRLAANLTDDDPRPVIILLHHSLGSADEDLLDTDRLLGVLSGNPRVKLLIHGHIHRWSRDEAAGIPVVSLPSCGFWFEPIDWVGWVEMEIGRAYARLTPNPLHPRDGLEPFEVRW